MSSQRVREAEPGERATILELWTKLLRTHRTLSPGFPLAAELPESTPVEGAPSWRAALGEALDRDLRDPDADVWVTLANGRTRSAPEGAGGRVVGFCIARWTPAPSPLEESSRGTLDEIFVETSERGHGLGRELAQRAFDALGRRGARRVEVRVLRENRDAHAFWRALGFRTAVEVMERSLGER